MTTFDRVKKLADKQKISIVELEEKLEFGRNSLYSWKTKTPNGDRLKKVADFFGVSTDYLLGRTDDPHFIASELEEEDDYERELLMMFRKGEKEAGPEKRDLYRKQTKDLMSFISKTMKELDEEDD